MSDVGPINRVLIVGGSGYLGSALAMALREEYEVFMTYQRNPVRIDNTTAFSMDCLNGSEILTYTQRFNPDIVLYCAGLHHPHLCLQSPMLAEALNFRSPTLFFKALSKPVPFVYFSMDLVFGKDSGIGPFSEVQEATPDSELGRSKSRGESLVISHSRLTYIFRLGSLYGEVLGAPQSPRGTWLQSIHESLEKNEKTARQESLVRSHLYIGDLARALKVFLKNLPDESRIYHLSDASQKSRYDLSQEFAKIWNYNSDLISEPMVDEKNPIPRNISLQANLFEQEYKFRCQNSLEGLAEMKERLQTGYLKAWS